MPVWIYEFGWLIWPIVVCAVGLALGRGHNHISREEYEADKRRLEGGTIYNDIMWEMKGEAERSLRRLLNLIMDADTTEKQQLLAEEIEAHQRQLDRIHRLLNFKQRGER